jgi:hypothetical protein
MLVEWALDKDTKRGFEMLMERDMPELLAEAVVLRHPSRFSPDVLDAACGKLVAAGIDPSVLQQITKTTEAS